MEIVFTTKRDPISRLIRWSLEEPVSHVAFLHGNVVIDSDAFGVELSFYDKWVSCRSVVHKLQSKDQTKDSLIFDEMCEHFWGDDYDYGAFFYFGYRALMRKFKGTPLPTENPWASDDNPMCVGLGQCVQKVQPGWFSKPIKEFDMITPYGLYLNMLKSGQFISS